MKNIRLQYASPHYKDNINNMNLSKLGEEENITVLTRLHADGWLNLHLE